MTRARGGVAQAACLLGRPASLSRVPGPSILKLVLNPGLREARLSHQLFPGGDACKVILLNGSEEKGGLGSGDGGPLSPAFLQAVSPGPGRRFPPVLPQLVCPLILKPNLDPGLWNAFGLGQPFSGGDGRVRVPFKAGSQDLAWLGVQASLLRHPHPLASAGRVPSEGIGRAIVESPGWNFTDGHGQREVSGLPCTSACLCTAAGAARRPARTASQRLL